jgi:dTDP-4-dehydrorhamnose 3,5-epimerase
MFVDEIDGVVLNPLKIVENPKGKIMHALKKSSTNFVDFGEAYFSFVDFNEIKGWKKHSRMKLNLVVPIGEIEFRIYDEREGSRTFGKYFKVSLSQINYQRLSIEPGLWLAFKGISREQNMLLNIANIEHDPNESENKGLNEINFL